MKVTVNVSEADLEFVDAFARRHGLPTRSSVLIRAIRLLRDPELERDYVEAWDEWEQAGESEAWDAAFDGRST